MKEPLAGAQTVRWRGVCRPLELLDWRQKLQRPGYFLGEV
jgi:hypothetical protein